MSRSKNINLLENVVSSYDKDKTTIFGRVAQKTIDGVPCLGSPISNFIDVATDTAGLVPTGSIFVSKNKRMFIAGTISAGVIPIILYDFDTTTGAYSYVGRVNLTSPIQTTNVHTVRSIKVVDSVGNTGWKIFVCTSSTVVVNVGGTFLANNIDKADFGMGAPITIPFATGNDQKAMYFLQNPLAIGTSNAETALVGAAIDFDNNKLYCHNGVAATHQYFVRSTNITPEYTQVACSVSVATPGVVSLTAHGYINNDVIVFLAGTLPTGLSLNTNYFVKNKTNDTFELSLTSGGASINTTGSPSVGAMLGRSYGITTSGWSHKTGNLPALVGTLLSVDSEKLAIPVNAPLNGAVLNGNSCIFLATISNIYLGKMSDLTDGATTWPSLTTANLLGSANEVTVPGATLATWSDFLDSSIFTTSVSRFIVKKVVNNIIESNFGTLNNTYYETKVNTTIEIGAITINSMYSRDGWLFFGGGTAGQRGIFFVDIYSDILYDFSYIITPVVTLKNARFEYADLFELLYTDTGSSKIYYRTTGFNSATGNWVELTPGVAVNVPVDNEIQFKIMFYIQSDNSSCPAQVTGLTADYKKNDAISDNWEYSHDYSSSSSPTKSAFRLKEVYKTVVPTLYFRTYDLDDNLLINHNTATNPTYFEFSNDGGLTWSPLGTIPNVVGTLVRYNFTSPPGVDVRPGLLES